MKVSMQLQVIAARKVIPPAPKVADLEKVAWPPAGEAAPVEFEVTVEGLTKNILGEMFGPYPAQAFLGQVAASPQPPRFGNRIIKPSMIEQVRQAVDGLPDDQRVAAISAVVFDTYDVWGLIGAGGLSRPMAAAVAAEHCMRLAAAWAPFIYPGAEKPAKIGLIAVECGELAYLLCHQWWHRGPRSVLVPG